MQTEVDQEEWIDCSERLPESSGFYLVKRVYDNTRTEEYQTGKEPFRLIQYEQEVAMEYNANKKIWCAIKQEYIIKWRHSNGNIVY